MAGKYSGCMMWSGSEFEYNGVSCTFKEKYAPKKNWEKRIDTVFDWLTHEKTPANLVMLYIEEPDDKSHKYGYKSQQVSFNKMDISRLFNPELLSIIYIQSTGFRHDYQS